MARRRAAASDMRCLRATETPPPSPLPASGRGSKNRTTHAPLQAEAPCREPPSPLRGGGLGGGVAPFGHSPTYGSSPMNRARLTASLTARWKAAQLPLRFRLNSLPWLVQSFFSVLKSL